MVCNTQNHFVLGFIVWYSKKTRKHEVSETESVPYSEEGKERYTLLGPLQRANLNHCITHVEVRSLK
jgi:hypothetical protein